MRTTRLRHVVDALGRFPFDARTQFAGLLALIAYCVHQALVWGSTFDMWDFHAISGFALLLIAVRVATRLDGQLRHALRRLCARGVIACSEDEFERLDKTLALQRRKEAPAWGLGIGLALAFAFCLAWDRKIIEQPLRLVLLAFELPGCYVAGFYVGWMVVQGRLVRVLKALDIDYSAQPGHPDGAAGLRPLGNFFLRQATLAGLPAAYLVFWIGVEPRLPDVLPVYNNPMTAYLVLVPLCIFIEVAAFVWPMWSFHRVMLRQKRPLVTQADEIAQRISSTQAELRKPMDPDQLKELSARLEQDRELYEELDGLPTWPVSKQIRRWFAVPNLLLMAIPIINSFFESNGT